MARGYCQCLLKCLCITVPPTYSVTTYFPHIFRHHVFPPPRISSPLISPTTYSVTTYFPHHVFRHHVFPPPRIPSPRISSTTYPDLHPATTTTTETDELLHDMTCFRSATDSNRIIIIIYLARPLTYCGRDICNCSKVNFLFEISVEASRRIIILYRR